MKLKIADRWKWLVKERQGYWYVHDTRPECYGSNGWRGNEWEPIDAAIFDLPDVKEWRDSLHEILPDGTLKKYMERPDLKVDDRVLVRSSCERGWLERHFSGWTTDGRMLCWNNGGTSWSCAWKSLDETKIWDEWKLPEPDQK